MVVSLDIGWQDCGRNVLITDRTQETTDQHGTKGRSTLPNSSQVMLMISPLRTPPPREAGFLICYEITPERGLQPVSGLTSLPTVTEQPLAENFGQSPAAKAIAWRYEATAELHRTDVVFANLRSKMISCERNGVRFLNICRGPKHEATRMKFLKGIVILFIVIYLLPTLASAGIWYMRDRPQSWRDADWKSAGILPQPRDVSEATIHVFSAATGGMKGSLASHAWIVTKATNAGSYNRYDKVGWGAPVRRNSYAPDAYWYSNMPRLVTSMKGEEAARLIPRIEAAIAAYPHSEVGGYRMWPGPNSNTFVAHVLRSVPELGVVLPPDAVGRNYLPEGRFFAVDADGKDVHATLYGLLGISVGARSGLEFHALGLVTGIDIARPGLKIPAIGRIGI